VGAISTASHGSGLSNSNISSAVREVTFVDYKGKLVVIGKEHEHFPAVAVSLGAFGVVYRLTLNVIPTLYLSQRVYTDLPLSALKDHFKDIMGSGYSVSLFTNLKEPIIGQIWVKKVSVNNQMPDWPKELFGAKINSETLHPHSVVDQPEEICTDSMGTICPWYQIFPLIKPHHICSPYSELQSEYFIPLENAYDAIERLHTIRHLIAPYLWGMEIRTIAADNLWLSPCYGKDCVAIHSTWKYDMVNVLKAMKLIEDQLAPWKPLPHWGKLSTLAPANIQAGYPKLDDWKRVVELYDPEGKFRNQFLHEKIFSKKSAL